MLSTRLLQDRQEWWTTLALAGGPCTQGFGQGRSLSSCHHPSFCYHTHMRGSAAQACWQHEWGLCNPCCPGHACCQRVPANGLGIGSASRLVCMQHCPWPASCLLFAVVALLIVVHVDQVQARELSFVQCARSGCSFEACVSAAWWVAPVRAVCCKVVRLCACMNARRLCCPPLELNSWGVCLFVRLCCQVVWRPGFWRAALLSESGVVCVSI